MALEDIVKNRLHKRKELSEGGANPYPVFIKHTSAVSEVLVGFSKFQRSGGQVSIAGRLMGFRGHGGLTFADLKDGTAAIQVIFREDVLGKNPYADIAKYLDIGDFISVTGTPFKTKRGERSVEVRKYQMIAKSLRTLPEKWHGLQDVEERYRRRYLDILMNEDVRGIFTARAKILSAVRAYLEREGFIEVETPVLQNIAGGAAARPFKTHLNALDLDMYLRISPELYLKRLLVGGFDKVYELGRSFRNEGVDFAHSPEFTMLEFYWAYSDYKEGMKFTEKFLSSLVKDVLGKKKLEYEGKAIDFSGTWERLEFRSLLQRYAKVDYDAHDASGLRKQAEKLGVKIDKKIYSKAEVADQIYKKIILPNIVRPTFVIHYPSEMLPLAKPLDGNPAYAASFQLVVAGWELVKAYSELNDPVLQRKFFEEQERLKRKGDEEAHTMDEDFVEALEYGMPPALGLGLGIDRLTALLAGVHSLREVILFPTMRPK